MLTTIVSSNTQNEMLTRRWPNIKSRIMGRFNPQKYSKLNDVIKKQINELFYNVFYLSFWYKIFGLSEFGLERLSHNNKSKKSITNQLSKRMTLSTYSTLRQPNNNKCIGVTIVICLHATTLVRN